MLLYRAFFILTTTAFLFTALPLKSQDTIWGNAGIHCVSDDEQRLYELISEYRRVNNLPGLTLSKSLCYVARVHMMDLSMNRPDFGGCNPHSWSSRGPWKPCCYARDEKRIACMTNKPRELTPYKSPAWEIVYEAGEPAGAEDAFDLWTNISITKEYFLNTGKWTRPWKTIGIGIYGDYACVWFGESDDPEGTARPCSEPAEAVPAAADAPSASGIPQFFIITGSLNTLEKANSEVARLRSAGYSDARLLPSGSNFRIAIASYPSEPEAQKQLPAIQQKFPGAWVLKPESP
jgi:hypothetical protein